MNERYKKIALLNVFGVMVSVALGNYVIAFLNLIAAASVYITGRIEVKR
ncbi:hypothetical protein [Marinilactibacillus sp. Marseille-P9653]|nr:hypothetical protein [Marinilactibacillus sp. Marseille-P9653]